MTVPHRMRTALKQRAGECCEICGQPGNNAHHRKNKSQGGRDALSNLMLLCGSGVTGCHGFVTESPAAAYTYGWSVHSYDAPEKTPVAMFGGHWWLLRDNGEKVAHPVGGVA